MISYNDSTKTFKLDTPGTSYVMVLIDEGKYLGHAYYGKKIADDDVRFLTRFEENPFTPGNNPAEKQGFFDVFPMEYPFGGTGDNRAACINVIDKFGGEGLELVYKSHKIIDGKPDIPGLPASFSKRNDTGEGTAKTLIITLTDEILSLDVDLYYSVFDDVDVITRSVRVHNAGNDTLFLTRCLSACLDMDAASGEKALSFYGTWAREHQIEIRDITYGGEVTGSLRGEEGHDSTPFIGILSKNADYKCGDVYGMNLTYSGDFLGSVKKNAFDSCRAVIGINPEHFTWKLNPDDSFYAPEAVLTFSSEGLGKMSRNYHDFYRMHLIRSPWQFKERPVLINNWEATYFDFDSDKLISIAKEAGKAGIELLVCDDGWFGHHRNQPSGDLGDWFVNEAKIHGGIDKLANEIKSCGLKLGLWFEPEMISFESDLYKAHPDWVLSLKGRAPSACRDQYVLDFSNPEVVDFIYGEMENVLKSAPIAYLKWDMNRPLSDVYSNYLPRDEQREIWHRHVLGVYEIQERLVNEFPELLIENCSSGGARFDAGMLYYSPQIWCSDDMDPIERLMIHEGTELLYPISSMGSHVCKEKNDITGRVVPFETRALCAMIGTFGYELDITKLSEEDRAKIPEQIALYKKIQPLILSGDYYRIASYRETGKIYPGATGAYDCVMVVAKDKKEAIVLYVGGLARPNSKSKKIILDGLDPDANYEITPITLTGNPPDKKFSAHGSTLMNAGMLIHPENKDFFAEMFILKVN